MTLPSPDSLFQLAWQEAIEQCPIRLVECVEAALGKIDPKAVTLEISERAMGALPRTKAYFDDRIEYYRRRRLKPPVDWSKTDPERVVRVYAYTHHLPSVMDYLRSLESYDFEKLIAALLKMAGAEESTVTPQVGDQGIDVIARFNASSKEPHNVQLGYQLASGPNVFVLVQCKRRADRVVSIEDIREFVGAVDILRIRGSEALSLRGIASAVAIGYRPFSAACMMYATTSTFDKGATKLADFLGMATVDGEGIAQAILDLGLLSVDSDKIPPEDFARIGELIV